MVLPRSHGRKWCHTYKKWRFVGQVPNSCHPYHRTQTMFSNPLYHLSPYLPSPALAGLLIPLNLGVLGKPSTPPRHRIYYAQRAMQRGEYPHLQLPLAFPEVDNSLVPMPFHVGGLLSLKEPARTKMGQITGYGNQRSAQHPILYF